MNKLIIIGNLTADPTSSTKDNKTVCNFTVAVSRRKKIEGQPEADFFRVAAWGRMAETCQQYLHKGSRCCVVGQISVRTYTANDGNTRASLDVFAEDVEFLGGSKHEDAPAEQTAEQPSAPAEMPGGFSKVETDELPF